MGHLFPFVNHDANSYSAPLKFTSLPLSHHPPLQDQTLDQINPTPEMELSIRRKSPRFSSVPAKSDTTTTKRKQKKPKSDELALSLHVIEPVPLNIYDPNFSARKCYRRSPRSTANEYRSSDNEDLDSIPLALPPIASIQCLRRSPRLISPVSDRKYVNLSKSDGALKCKSLPEKRKATFCASVEDSVLRKCLRKSPRLSSNLEGELLALPEPSTALKEKRSSRKMEVASGDSEISTSERCLRSRTVAFRVEVKSGIVELPEMKTPVRNESNLDENGSSIVSEKCLRSRKIPFRVVGDVHVEKKSALSELHKNMIGEGKMSGSDITSEKCLRSRKIISPVVGAEHVVKKSALIERPSKDHKGMTVKTDTIGSDITSKKCLRLRKITSPVVGDEHVEKKSALIELPIKEHKGTPPPMKTKTSGSDITSEKCIRSRKFTNPVALAEHVETKFGLLEWPNKDHTGTPVKNKMSSSNITSGKCLRSRKIPFPVVAADHVETKSSLMEWPNKEHNRKSVNTRASALSEKKPKKQKVAAFFVGEPIPDEEARERWSWRYELKGQRREGQGWILNADEEDEIILNVECHYGQAKVDGCIFSIGDCAFVRGDGREKHVGRILEFFKTTEGEDFFRVQWFYKAEDTVMKDMASFHDKKRLFFSTFMNDNLLDCIVSKVNVIEIARGLGLQPNSIQPSDFYYDMEYCVQYSTFRTLPTDNYVMSRDLSSINYTDTFRTTASTPSLEDLSSYGPHKAELALLDLYSGCGGMSTGLCLGAKLSSVNLVTRWAVDYNKAACESLKLNHPETQVRNMPAEDFLELLNGWEKLCKSYTFNDFEGPLQSRPKDTEESKISTNSPCDVKMPRGEFEVSFLVDISYGNIGKSGKHGLKFKVRWKGYDPSEDTWEPIEGLSNCEDHLRDFVRSGSKSKILPMPGDVDVICGGPPCQGISGYNRYRNIDDPLTDERNRQIVVFMDIVKFLKPKYVLMENVADILRFDKASLGRYALSRMVHMKYQARLGTMAAGCYGLPQFRLRVFIWGALPSEKLPQFPLPTHDVVVRYWPSPEFEQNTVAYDEGQPRELEEAVILRDAISDLPPVTSHETREEMTYAMHPETEFQKYIRLTKHEIMGFASRNVAETESSVLYDHRPYTLSEDDYLRVCHVPRRKGANFRDFPGVIVDKDNSVIRDPTKEPIMLPSGKPLVPDYVFTFEKGKSKRPFARLWWDETVATVVTFPSCHNQAALHPEQDRVLTLREYARLQGFPDFYRFCGTVKERYCQVGNAVAVPVARALGYALGMASRKLGGDGPVMTLPPKFSSQIPEKELKILSKAI